MASVDDLDAEIKFWQKVLPDPDKYGWSWSGSKPVEGHSMLCRICGASEREHDRFSRHSFESGGRTGHDLKGLPGVDSSNYQCNPLDIPKTQFITGMTVSKSNPKFHAALKKMAEVHDRKSLDYADTVNGNFYTNFEEAAATAGTSVEEVFLTLIGVKLARLRELKKKSLTPQNESVQDSRLDLANYAVLMYSFFID